MRKSLAVAAAVVGILGVTVAPAHAQSSGGGRFKVVDIGPGLPLSIDSQGGVVGTMLVDSRTHPFLWKDNGGLTDLFLQGATLGGQEAFAYGVSIQWAERRIVGSAFTGNGQLHAFALGAGGGSPGLTDLNGLGDFNGGHSSVSHGVNAQGEVVGYGYRTTPGTHSVGSRAGQWSTSGRWAVRTA